MKASNLLATIAGVLVLATAPAHALSFGFSFATPPEESEPCTYPSEDLPLQSNGPSDFWSAAFGCMGTGTSGPKNYVMTFLPYNGPSVDCPVVWELRQPDCPPQHVPDGGSTLALLGASLAGFVALRRRRAALAHS